MNRRLGVIRVSPCSPRVKITMVHGCDAPAGQAALFMKRVGEPTEFAVYPPLEVTGSAMLFQFDDLLFMRPQGRYEGRLTIGGLDRGVFYFEYRDVTVFDTEKV